MARDRTLRLGILLSGSGRTLQNIHDRIVDGTVSGRIVCVISSRADAYGVVRARAANLPVHVVSRRGAPDPEFHDRVTDILADAAVELVCMAGFTTLYRFPPTLAGRVINIHPALLPDFGGKGYYGMRVHQAVLEAGRRESGCTVHFCDEQYDHGPIILQRKVRVLEDDTPETLAARVFEQECIAYPEAINRLAERLGRVDAGGGPR